MGLGSRHLNRRIGWPVGGAEHRRLLHLALAWPLAALVLSVVALTVYCRHLLADAEAAEVGGSDLPLLVAAAGFLVGSIAVVALQASRLAHRVAGPEYRLVQAMQRLRTGDLSFRVHLRQGDLLTGLAAECNALIDWLNANPPPGARTGSDIVELVDDVEPAPTPVEVGA